MNKFTLSSFVLRLLFATAIVVLTFNPTGYSYYHWVNAVGSGFDAQHAFSGVVLLIGWTVLIRAAYRSLGAIGLLLASAFIGTLVWFLESNGLLRAESATAITWAALVSLSALLALGMSWSHIRRRLSGQMDVDDIGE